MKVIFLLFLFIISLQIHNSQAYEIMGNPVYLMGPQSSGLIDKTQYNSSDHAGSPLGWLETDSSALKVDLYYRFLRFDDYAGKSNKATSIAIPHIRLANPGKVVFDLQYNPYIMKIESENETLKLPLHRFGIGVAAGPSSGVFQAGLKADLYIGKESKYNDENKRFIIGSDEISLHLGSQVHELIRIGLNVGISGYFDSLICKDTSIQDRYFSGTFPRFGGFIDISKTNFPVHSNFCLNIGFPKFVYVSKPSINPFGNQDVIREDSVGWDWKTMVEISAANFNIKPAFKIGYKRLTSQIHIPEEDNYPWQYEEKIPESNWTTSSFGMGFGMVSAFEKFFEMNIEYSFNNFSIKNGPAFDMLPDQNEWFHRFIFGIQGNLNEITLLRLPETIHLRARAEYFNFIANQFIDSWKENMFVHLVDISNNSQVERYIPGSSVAFSRIAGFNTAIGSSFLNNMFGFDTNLMFLRDGFEFGLNLWYNLQKSQNM